MKKPIQCTVFCTLVSFFLSTSIHCQDAVYEYSFKKRKADFFISLAFMGAAQWYDASLDARIPINDVKANSKNLWIIDRNAINQHSTSAERMSDVLLYSSMAFPLIINAKKNGRIDRAGNIALMGLQGFMLEGGLNLFIKNLAQRPRPYVYDTVNQQSSGIFNLNSQKSFYSGHTSGAAYFAFFGAKVFSDLNPDSKLKPIIWSAAVALPAVTGFLRYKAGKHFPTDVLVGYVSGAAIGFLVPTFYKSKKSSLLVAPSGMRLTVSLQ